MATTWANGANAAAICDVCGFRFRLGVLRQLVVNTKLTEIKACPACWVPDQPQFQLGKFSIDDPQALKDPRPDGAMAASRVFQYGWAPVGGGVGNAIFGMLGPTGSTPNYLIAEGHTGSVTISGT